MLNLVTRLTECFQIRGGQRTSPSRSSLTQLARRSMQPTDIQPMDRQRRSLLVSMIRLFDRLATLVVGRAVDRRGHLARSVRATPD